MPALEEQIAQLEAAIAAQEALRPMLGDDAVNAIIAAARTQLAALRAQAGAGGVAARSTEQLLERLIPKELAAKIRASGHVEGERKHVTVLFADLSGFTSLSEQLDPEIIAALQDDLLPAMAGAVYQYEGFLDKYIGDAVMAIFGAPIAHEDDPERALRAALEMRSRMETLNHHWQERLGTRLALHIGVNTGTVVAGEIKADVSFSYTVTGDTVNTASRLQSAAQPGQILVSRSTYRLTQEAFMFAALDPITVKGKREPLAVFELQRAKLLPSKTRGVKELGSAFVGRADALTQLNDVLAELAAGRGRVVSINGEAGIGKSRLLAEWRKQAGERVRWAEGRAFAHTTSLAYGPFLDMFRRYARIQDDDSEAEARARLDAAIDHLLPNEADARAIFASLLGMRLLPDEASVIAALPAEALRGRLFALMQTIFERLAQAQPTVVIIEDLHWADFTSLDLIESLLPLTERLPLALVGVRRLHPDERPSKLRQVIEAHYARRFTDVALTHLSEIASLNMVEQLLGTAVPPTLQAIILRKAEGNPFFVEEVIRSLIHRGALVRGDDGAWMTTPTIESITIPDTVQGVLMARLDALPDETKWVVQQASVIGRIFLYRVLLQMSRGAVTASLLDDDLSRLEREELIRERVRLPEVEYIFKHALTQEVAYQSLLTPRRKELHRKVGEAMEAIFAERLNEFQSIIGEHFLKGEAWDKAADYLMKAGDAAARLNAISEARVHYAQSLEALSGLPNTDDQRRRWVDTIIRQVSVSFSADHLAQHLARLSEAESVMTSLAASADTTPDQLRLARVHFWIGRIHFFLGETREAIGYFRPVLDVAQALADEELLALPSSVIGRALGAQGRWAQAEPLLSQAVASLEKVANWYDWTITVGWLGVTRAARGRYGEGLNDARRALTRALSINHPTAIGACQLLVSFAYLMGRDDVGMLQSGRAAVETAEKSGDRVWQCLGYGLQAWAQSRLGQPEAAIASWAKQASIAEGLGGRVLMRDWLAAGHAETALALSRGDEAIARAEQAVTLANTIGGLFGGGLPHRTWGQALAQLAAPQLDDAEAHMAESLRLLEEGDARLEAARTHVAWGEVCRARGNINAAREHFQKAAAQFEASGLMAELESVRALPDGMYAEWRDA